MASYTPPVTHATGDILAVTDWNGVANDIVFLYQAPYANYYNSVSTPFTTSATTITLGGTTTTGYGFSISSNALQTPLTGIYSVSYSVSASVSSSSATLTGGVAQNGTIVAQNTIEPSSNVEPYSGGTTLLSCANSDTLTLVAFVSAGSAITNTGNIKTYLTAFFVGSQ